MNSKKYSNKFFLYVGMEDTSEHVKLQLQDGNKIYESVVSSNAVAEKLMNGDNSEVAATVSHTSPISSAMGNYTKQVEVLSVSALPAENVEGNEVQVSIIP